MTSDIPLRCRDVYKPCLFPTFDGTLCFLKDSLKQIRSIIPCPVGNDFIIQQPRFPHLNSGQVQDFKDEARRVGYRIDSDIEPEDGWQDTAGFLAGRVIDVCKQCQFLEGKTQVQVCTSNCLFRILAQAIREKYNVLPQVTA